MLDKQDDIITLEEELDRIDREEPRVLFLGNHRRDRNEERKNIMSRIDKALESYGT
jgi:vacuolar-type H+-ATPase subunit F/Vma7